MLTRFAGAVLMSALVTAGPADAHPHEDPADSLCHPSRATFVDAFRSEKVVLFVVRGVKVEPDPFPDDGLDLVRGTYELIPLGVLQGSGEGERITRRFDATLSKDFFLGIPCRWQLKPVEGAIWLGSGTADGEDCPSCDKRLDATHALDWLGPLTLFARRRH